MRRMLRQNGLSITMFGLFLTFLLLQSIAGWRTDNQEAVGANQLFQQLGSVAEMMHRRTNVRPYCIADEGIQVSVRSPGQQTLHRWPHAAHD